VSGAFGGARIGSASAAFSGSGSAAVAAEDIGGERILQGFPVSPGIAIQQAFVLDTEHFQVPERFIGPEEVEAELQLLETAREQALTEVKDLQVRYRDVLGSETVDIFKFHQLMLMDQGLREDIAGKIREDRFTAAYAITRAFLTRIQAFRSLEDSYLREREADLADVKRRLLRALFGTRREELKSLTGPVCLVARDLAPSQTATLDTTKVIGFAIDAGGRTSHTAIVARALGIPAVVGLGDITRALAGGDTVIIDGTKGVVVVNPTEETLKVYRARRTQFIEFARDLTELRSLPAETIDGYRITILANIEYPGEIAQALENGAEGIGLYRSEFLYTEGEPDEEVHFRAYRRAVEEVDGRPLVIRTLDLGADKFSEHLNHQLEPNPFLGCRSIRYCFQRPELFRMQLRAILRASAYGPIKIMLPMISSLEEVRASKKVIFSVMDELEREGINFDDRIPVGIMVEVPSAALTADLLAQEVAFLSIGTNDLVQYTLAVDRMNERVADLYQPAHPAVLRLIRNVIEAGRRHGVEVSMCGEMSGEVAYTLLLVGMGLRTFSISPGSIPEVKKVTRAIAMRESMGVVERIFSFAEATETEAFLRERAQRIIPELF
jgi:phosphotransferase system enzyme I (PtsI)